MRQLVPGLLLIATMFFHACSANREEPVTAEEALVMAKQIDSAIQNNKPNYFLSLINEDIFSDRVAKAAKIKHSRSLAAGIRKGLKNADLGKQISEAVGNGSNYEFVKHYEKDKVQHLIFRLYGTDGLNYHDFELTKVKGNVYVSDIFFYITGENFSKSLADFAANVLKENGYNVNQADIQKLYTVRRLTDQGQFERAKKEFDKLPEAMRNQKLTQVYYLTICSGLNEEIYQEALEAFEARFASEPNMYLSLVDAYIMRKEYEKALNAINRIDAMIDKDPFLDYCRSICYSNMEKKEEAVRALENLHRNKPDFDMGVLELIVHHLSNGDYDKARPIIKEYRSNPDFNQEYLNLNLISYPDLKLDDPDQ